MFAPKKHSPIKISKSRSLWRKVIGGFLLTLWIFSSFDSALATKACINHSQKSSQSTDNSLLLSADIDPSRTHPFDPNLPNSTPEEQDEFDEKEKEDNSDDDWKILCRTSLRYTTSSEKALTARNTQSIQNRNSVYLFILFHSWKIFLA